MNFHINTKSALAGLVLGVVVTLCFGAAAPGPLPGRFQVSASSAHGLVVDTATGKVWVRDLRTQGSTPGFFEPKLGKE